jgi:hypothetical protein
MQLPKWVRLSEALQCVMRTGVSEKQAKRDLCNALADRKIRLRFCYMWRPTAQDFLTGRDKPTMEVRRVANSQIPAILKPSDFNWRRSQVRQLDLWLKIRGPGVLSLDLGWSSRACATPRPILLRTHAAAAPWPMSTAWSFTAPMFLSFYAPGIRSLTNRRVRFAGRNQEVR